MNTRFKKIWSWISGILVSIVVILAIVLVGVRLWGFTPYAIISPSMTPKYQVGDLVYVRSTVPENIKQGDVITFVANEDLLVVTHRVYGIDTENRCFITKGDANNVEDSAPVRYENVLGVVSFSLPKLGYVSMYIGTRSGRYVCIMLGCLLILILIIPEFFKSGNKKMEIN